MIEDCDETHDVAPDGLLWCVLPAGHEGMHKHNVWWMPVDKSQLKG